MELQPVGTKRYICSPQIYFLNSKHESSYLQQGI
jgi:hypothetical protein